MVTVSPFVLISNRGMLGRAMADQLEYHALPFTALNREQFDLTKPESIATGIHPGVRYVINCAAWTDVDGAEVNEAAATAVNGEGVGALATRCAQVGAMLITFGTDYVFRGTATSPYPTGEPRSPINAYGRSKARGEQLLEQSNGNWLNIRTSWLYAPWGKNFVLTIRRLLHEKPSIKVVNDQRGRPTSAAHLASTTLAMIDAGLLGHQHITDGGECTWFEFAGEIGRLSGAPGQVAPCTSGEFPRPAARPAYSVLDLADTEAVLGPMPHWRESLERVLRAIEPHPRG